MILNLQNARDSLEAKPGSYFATHWAGSPLDGNVRPLSHEVQVGLQLSPKAHVGSSLGKSISRMIQTDVSTC